MICERIKPSPILQTYIKEFLILHLIFKKGEEPPVKSYPVNPEEGMTFHVRGVLEASTLGQAERTKRARCVLFGQPEHRQNLFLPNEFLMVHVRFQPGAIFKLLRIPMAELLHQNIDASLIWGREIDDLNDKLAHVRAYEELIRLLEEFYLRQIKKVKNNFQPVELIGRYILERPEDFRLIDIASKAFLSVRQFEKRFERQIGVTPKYFSRICRFYKAYELKDWNPEMDWLTVAVNSGYNDYQHLAKDFKTFSGITPVALLQEALKNPERRKNVATGFRGL